MLALSYPLTDLQNFSAEKVSNIMQEGLDRLPPIQQKLIHAVFFDEMKALKRTFKAEYKLSSSELDRELAAALRSLRSWFRSHQINHLHDIE
jgi:hypothetical protein